MSCLDEMGAGPVGGYSKNQLWDKIHRLEAERDEITKEFNKLADGLYAAHKAKAYLADRDHRKARAEALERALRASAEPEARALTLDELREMDGMLIYTKTIGVIGSGRWELIAFDDHWIYLKTAHEHYKMTREELSGSYGKTWVAYDRQPRGARNNETS